jgi:predicted ABC-type ATPase
MLHVLQVWYVGLEGADLHIARVRSRGAMGGHDISESNGRERYDVSKMKLIELLARPTESGYSTIPKKAIHKKGKLRYRNSFRTRIEGKS